MFTQLITPNPNIKCQPGWCLQYVRQTFGLPARYGTATEAWEKSPTQHRDRNFPSGCWIPVWYGLDNEPAGHVVLRAPNGSVYSTSDLGNTPHLHPDLGDLERYYAYYGMTLTYRGWTEDVAGYPVIANTGIASQGTITPVTEEEDMGHVDSMSDDAMKALAKKLWEYDFTNTNGKPNRPIWILQSLPETFAGMVRDTINGVLRGPLTWFGFDGKQPSEGRTTTSVETALGFADTIANEHTRQITELRAVVDQLALGQGVSIDYQKIAEAVVNEEAKRLTPPEGK